jgi:hypothetical protein
MKKIILILTFVFLGFSFQTNAEVKKQKRVEGPRVHNLAPEFIKFWKTIEKDAPTHLSVSVCWNQKK